MDLLQENLRMPFLFYRADLKHFSPDFPFPLLTELSHARILKEPKLALLLANRMAILDLPCCSQQICLVRIRAFLNFPRSLSFADSCLPPGRVFYFCDAQSVSLRPSDWSQYLLFLPLLPYAPVYADGRLSRPVQSTFSDYSATFESNLANLASSFLTTANFTASKFTAGFIGFEAGFGYGACDLGRPFGLSDPFWGFYLARPSSY